MQNHLKNETSPYLLQHADNPVDWYPWGKEVFEKAKREDKPVFLSIGYSTCHWCHVMAHESFEDDKVAEVLNRYFVSIKVDKEERPDVDSIYMSVCQALTGSGGWPTTIFMTPDQKPFFAGTYFPKTARYGQIGFVELLLAVHEKWRTSREDLLQSAEEIIAHVRRNDVTRGKADGQLISSSVAIYRSIYDKTHGGFGSAPKFPTPHNLLFLMEYYERSGEEDVLAMVEHTLMQMYRGGLFDHIGGGFSRYSTDAYFLAPHFEKMLYDNAMLLLAYSRAYEVTRKQSYRNVAERTAGYILREMKAPEGGFYSAQDADSEGVEGKYYLFEPQETERILGAEKGKKFNLYFDITKEGNFEGKSIPNLLKTENLSDGMEDDLQPVYEYRKKRYALHLDDKILTSWNGLMIAAMCSLYRVTKNERYLEAAKKAQSFLENNLCEEGVVFTRWRDGKRSENGFLDDYANEIFALLALYKATLEQEYLNRAMQLCRKTVSEFYDEEQGGFYLYGTENEQLIFRPKETYDGAIPSGNSMMAYNLVQLEYLTEDEWLEEVTGRQLDFMASKAKEYPAGYAMFLLALSEYQDPAVQITVVTENLSELKDLPCKVPLSAYVRVVDGVTEEYSMKNGKTTYYVCEGRNCLPASNELNL
ncbi:MAG: thioredoxin domain-containing protein [Lachnospiraceae bacterium]|nr:thioredoxin domain-containing protein [Lachnospiraceae bacterium]